MHRARYGRSWGRKKKLKQCNELISWQTTKKEIDQQRLSCNGSHRSTKPLCFVFFSFCVLFAFVQLNAMLFLEYSLCFFRPIRGKQTQSRTLPHSTMFSALAQWTEVDEIGWRILRSAESPKQQPNHWTLFGYDFLAVVNSIRYAELRMGETLHAWSWTWFWIAVCIFAVTKKSSCYYFFLRSTAQSSYNATHNNSMQEWPQQLH